jgi:hypothetical protein
LAVWPPRPIRCSPLATDGGASIWNDEIDRAHVDAQLQRRGGDQRAQGAGFEQIFDLDPLRPRRSSRDANGPASRRRAR